MQHLLSIQGKPAWTAMWEKGEHSHFGHLRPFCSCCKPFTARQENACYVCDKFTLTMILPVCLRNIYSMGGIPYHCHCSFPFSFKTPLFILIFYTLTEPSMLPFNFSFLFLWSNPPQFKLNLLPLSGWKDLLRITLDYVNQPEQKWLLISYQFRCWLVLVVFWPLLDLT